MNVTEPSNISPKQENEKSSSLSGIQQTNGKASLNFLENQKVEKVKTSEISLWPGNPRRGDIAGIAESIKKRGQFRPLLIQKSSGQIIAGNQTYQAITEKLKRKTCLVVYLDVDDEMAKEILVADNRFGELGHNDASDLYAMLKSMDNPSEGTGYEPEDVWKVFQGFEERDQDVLNALSRPNMTLAPMDLGEIAPEADNSISGAMERAKSRTEAIVGKADAETTAALTDTEMARDALQLKLEAYIGLEWPSDNYWGIPTLSEDMLVQSLPADLTKFDTWGGGNINGDDGDPDRWWLYGWDVGARKGLPWDRSILHFFTQDERFQMWLDNPAEYIAHVVSEGCTQAVTIDVSYYAEETRYRHLESIYITNWVGRLMQEAGLKIIPRLQWVDIESLNYAFLGIPENAPVVAIQMHTVTEDEAHELGYQESFRLLFQKLKPKQLLVYTGPTGRKIVESMPIPSSVEVVYLENFTQKRRVELFGKSK